MAAVAVDGAKKMSGKSEGYLNSLIPEDKQRYKEKLSVRVGQEFFQFPNPYDIWDDKKVWSDSPAQWPKVTFVDIFFYLLETPGPFNKEKLKAYKSLEAYDYFISRKVGPVYSFIGEESVSKHKLLRAEVRPGQAESVKDSHLAWLISTDEGKILCGHCDCKAGLGETCSHVAALLFKVETGVRIGLTDTSCTSEACRWNKVFGSNSLTAPVEEINFKPGKMLKEATPRESCPKTARTPFACTNGDESYMEAYYGHLQNLKMINPTACVFKSLPRLDPEETDTANSETDKSQSAYDSSDESEDDFFEITCTTNIDPLKHPLQPLDPPGYPLVGSAIEKFTSSPLNLPAKYIEYTSKLHVTYEEAHRLECITQKQSECPQWFKLKYPRLTASNFGRICEKMSSRRSKPELVARDMLSPSAPSSFVNNMLKYGKDNEATAVQVYKGMPQNKHIQVHECGIFISPEDSFLGASPDRVLYDPKMSNPWGLMEVKCPYKARNIKPTEATKLKKFMCTQENGLLKLARNHQYYYQVQGQMALSGAKWCDFVVYTKCGLAVERISYDPCFWSSAVKHLSSFFYEYFLPKYIEIIEAPNN